jgi:arylsulfatase A-like enzyme
MPPGEPRADTAAGTVPREARARAIWSAFWTPIRVGVVLWLLDALWLAREPVRHAASTAIGVLAGLCFTLCVGAASGGVFALFRWVARTPAWGVPSSRLGRVGVWLREAVDPAESLRRSGLLLALPGLAGAYALGSVLVGQRVVVSMARPEFIALALLALHLVLLGLFVVLAPVATSVGSWVAWVLRRIPVLGPRLFARPWHIALWLGLGFIAATGAFVYVYREPLGYLPLRELGFGVGALALAGLYTVAVARLSSTVLLLPRALFAVTAGAAIYFGFSLTPSQMFSRHIAEQGMLSGRVAHAALMLAFDADRDGYLPMFGGGDCAPFDPKKNPGALDVPSNRIDEDCDGADLDPKSLPRLGIYDRRVPQDLPKRPPIVLITVDAFAARSLRSLGGTREVTPNIDAFAKRSVLFTQCFAQGPSTRLSFPALFTSRWDTQIRTKLVGKHPFPIEVSEKMLAEVLRDAGYETSAVTSDAYFARSRWNGLTQGFVHVDETPFARRPSTEHSGSRVTDAAIEALEREAHGPQFLWAHYYDAHSPHTRPVGAPDFGKAREDLYAAELWNVDREVGRLLAHVEAQFEGQALVILTGDHGIAFDAPRHEKFNYGYDLSTIVLNVPLIVHAPFLQARRVENVVSTMDIAPTLANLLRLPGPFAFEGVSLVPELLAGKAVRPALLMHQMFLEERLWKNDDPLERVSLRNDRYNLVHERKGGFFELYDYQRDYLERQDLASDPAYEAVLRELRKELMLLVYQARPKGSAPKVKAEPKPAKTPRSKVTP